MASTGRDVLPSSVRPKHYNLHLYDLQFGAPFKYSGLVTINLEIDKPTQVITLNAHHLTIEWAQMFNEKTANITYDEATQRCSLNFCDMIAANTNAPLQISFSGTINNDMAGFYRSKYKPLDPPTESVATEDGHHLMFSTQFESCDARRALPCFDEPNLKASFDVSLEIPTDLTALSNMPEKDSVDSDKPGLKLVSFETSPRMSTYLLAWTVGHLEYIETFTERKYNGKQLPVRVYTTPGYRKQGQLGAEVCAKVVDFYSDTFKLEYPLPKIDLVAVHEFSHNAMENWGLITYRTTAILYDPESSDASYKKKVAYVVAHELAHQWFGNLVTMDWWSELWLNEGFATWVGWHAVDNFYPEFESWPQFVAEAMQTAQNLDSLRASHPVEVDVRRAEEVEQIFDAISYLKGSSVIRMLVAHLGKQDFFNGIAAYLKKHAYNNATTNDLWAALSDASGKDVKLFMDAWIRKIGFPVLTVAEEPGQIGLKQSRFLSSGDVQPEEDETTWWIPILKKPATEGPSAVNQQLSSKMETLRHIDDSHYKLNADQVGFYRTNYPPARLAQLGAEKNRLSVEDRIGLIADAAAMAVAGQGTTAGLLTLIENFQDETSFAVWTQLAASLAHVRSIFSENSKVAEGLKRFALRLFTPAVEKIGWNYAKDENFLTGQLRPLLITAAGGAGHQTTIEHAKSNLQHFLKGDKTAIHPSLRTAVFRVSIQNGDSDEFEAVKDEFAKTTSIDGKEVCLTALGQAPTPELADKVMRFIFSDAVATQDLHFGAVSLAANPKGRQGLWQFVTKEWPTVSSQLAARPIVMDRFIKNTLSRFASHDMEKEIAGFFEGKEQKGWDRAVVQAIDNVRTNARYRERDEALVMEWLQAHGYTEA